MTTTHVHRSWEELTEVEQLQCLYSDLHKDVYGFRPRNDLEENWNSAKYLQEQLDFLQKELVEVMEREANEQREAVEAFEKLVQITIGCGAKDRDQAIRWICGEEFDDRDYMCYKFGLPYGYLNEVK